MFGDDVHNSRYGLNIAKVPQNKIHNSDTAVDSSNSAKMFSILLG